MTTPTGTITMLDVILELDGAATPREITFNDADVRDLAEVPTGEITMDDMRGKSSSTIVITGNITVGQDPFVQAFGFRTGGQVYGSLADVVGLPPYDAVPAIDTLNDHTNGVQQLSITTGTDLTTYQTKIRIYGNGRDVTLGYDFFTYDFGVSQSSINSLGHGQLFTVADVGLTYAFEIFS